MINSIIKFFWRPKYKMGKIVLFCADLHKIIAIADDSFHGSFVGYRYYLKKIGGGIHHEWVEEERLVSNYDPDEFEVKDAKD